MGETWCIEGDQLFCGEMRRDSGDSGRRRFKGLICSVTKWSKTEAMIPLKSVRRISYLAPLSGIWLHVVQHDF
jgi:hypothetical protein